MILHVAYFANLGGNGVATWTPLLVLDMYEHSYALDYGAGHAKYIDAFLANARWDVVDARLTRGLAAARALGG